MCVAFVVEHNHFSAIRGEHLVTTDMVNSINLVIYACFYLDILYKMRSHDDASRQRAVKGMSINTVGRLLSKMLDRPNMVDGSKAGVRNAVIASKTDINSLSTALAHADWQIFD